MPVAFGTTTVNAVYHGSTLIADLRHGTTQVPISSTTAPDAPTGVGVTVSDYSVPDAPTGVSVTVSEGADEFFSDVVLLLQDSLADDSYQGHTLTITGNTQLDASNAKIGNYGIAFDGNGDYIQTTVDSSLHITGDCTIEFWMKSSGPNSQRIISHRSSGSGDANLLGVFLSSGTPRFRIGPDLLNSNTVVNDGQWHHIACVRSGSNQYIFVDGAVAATRTTTSFSFNPVGLQLYIGRDPFDSQYFNGVLDGLRFTNGTARYTSAFTPPAASFPTTNGDPDFADVELLLQDSFTDQSLSGQTVNALNTQLSTTTKKVGTHSLQFNGSNAYANTSANTLAFGTGPFTVELWLYWDGTVTGSPWIGVLGAHNGSFSGGAGDRYGIYIQASTGNISHYIRTAFPTPVAFSANTWTHIASTRDSSGVCRLFVDGILKRTSTDAGSLTSTGGFFIGTDNNPGRPRLSGFIDELRITVGTCRYTANFTPPTQEFPN